mmetsp:Transcript_66001/g.148934  ORF Transcript_66001/g.148934 Transcript_66001/m.148934 type:complete len:201 (-) Transcript_66001:1161-1763(-)
MKPCAGEDKATTYLAPLALAPGSGRPFRFRCPTSLCAGAEFILLEPATHPPLGAAVDEALHVPLLAAWSRVHDAALVRKLRLVETKRHCHLNSTTRGLVVAVFATDAALHRFPARCLSVHEERDPRIGQLLKRGSLTLLVVLALLLQHFLLTADGGSRCWLQLTASLLDCCSLHDRLGRQIHVLLEVQRLAVRLVLHVGQ